MFDLAGEARRLRASLAVALRWYEVALEGDETGHLTAKAEYTRDQLEEELFLRPVRLVTRSAVDVACALQMRYLATA